MYMSFFLSSVLNEILSRGHKISKNKVQLIALNIQLNSVTNFQSKVCTSGRLRYCRTGSFILHKIAVEKGYSRVKSLCRLNAAGSKGEERCSTDILPFRLYVPLQVYEKQEN